MLQLIRQARHRSTFKRALENCEPEVLKGVWGEIYPHHPKLENNEQAEIALHMARTGSKSLALEKRLYSHAWLFERGFPSQLPDELKPKFERKGPPVIFEAVGIAVSSSSSNLDRQAEAKYVEKIMSDAVSDMYTCGITDPKVISQHMWQARDNYLKKRLKVMI